MKKICLIGAMLIFSCSSVNKSRKSAGISRQKLFTTSVKVDNKQTILPTLFWSHYDASQRGGIYMVNPDGTVKIISENPPDVAINNTIDALAKVNIGDKVDVGAKFSAIKSVAELGQKNAANYMIRDLAFRIEALKINSETIAPEIINIYEKLIQSAENISIAESKNSKSKNKAEILKELNQLIKFSKDTTYKDLKIDSTFIKKIGKIIDED